VLADADDAALYDLMNPWDPSSSPADRFYHEQVMAADSVRHHRQKLLIQRPFALIASAGRPGAVAARPTPPTTSSHGWRSRSFLGIG